MSQRLADDWDDPDSEKLNRALRHSEPMTVVISAAVFIEAELDRFIDQQAVDRAAVKRLQLDFSRKGDLAMVLGLNGRLRAPLTAIGKIRNRFAHTLEASIDASATADFYETFDPEDKEIIAKVVPHVRGLGDRPSLRSLDPLDQFIVLTLSLRSAIIAARLLASPTSRR